MVLTLKKLEKAIKNSLGRDTCYYKFIWDDKTQVESAGHCRVVALIVNDYFGGEIFFAHVVGNSNYTHYWNKLSNGKEVDFTKDQFSKDVKLTVPKIILRKQVLDNIRIKKTYPILKKKVANFIKEN
ncbi:MAG: hypothetical protein QT05_C0001G0003 [archaeon GW2011_AR13]|nr:MAG: hypothetical protein QT05_C0001G0003 [archaeon GW2011_AR13]HIG94800.1 hypothetical protein [Nanoarchaeota archaeon]HIH63091.1 hypothetical protein [Nanoarchaeota archaeon]HIJ09482.1 hypothetical protein [Nanoarchaeota archaeon]